MHVMDTYVHYIITSVCVIIFMTQNECLQLKAIMSVLSAFPNPQGTYETMGLE